MTKRMRRYTKKRARRRRHILYCLLIVCVLSIGLLAVDLSSTELLLGERSVNVFALREVDGQTMLTLFGTDYPLPVSGIAKAAEGIRQKLWK